jgi:subtilisin family serine protease
MDAALRLAVEGYAEAMARVKAGVASAPEAATLFHSALPYGLLAGEDGEPVAPVFVRLDRPESVEGLKARGATIVLQDGDLVIARLPVSRVIEAAADPSVRSMVLSKRWTSEIDSSRIRSRVRDVHQGGGTLSQAYLGTGVLLGVLDSGIDYTHDDFRTSATNSRLLALFDYSQGATGAECRPGQLDSLTCPEIDGTGGFGHGTHVTGIASGNGRRNPQYVGMAPEADLLFVKGMRSAQSSGGFLDSDVVNGVAWMLNKALALGRPIAINLSLGGQFGAHDGTSLQERFMDRFAGPGRIIVAAAGNSGDETIHASYPVEGTDYNTALETGLVLGAPAGIVDIWAPQASNFSVGVVVYDAGNVSTPRFVSTAAAPGQLVTQNATGIGGTYGKITIDARTTTDPNNGARNVVIQIEPVAGGVDPSTKLWSVYTFGTGTFDMWCATRAIFFPPGLNVPAWFRAGDSLKTIGMPATAKRILCIGSHVTKTAWVDIDGVPRTQPNATLDAISRFSSLGPSRDGRVLPNLTAPGEAIISALSKDYPADRQFIVQGGGYQEQQGTSQAAPHITGIATLMLQRDPSLTPENVRSILQQSATPAGGPVPNNTFGYGRVNALAALQATPDPIACTVVLPFGRVVPCDEVANEPLSLMAYPNPSPEGVRFAFVTPRRGRVDLAVYDLMGRRLKTVLQEDATPGGHGPVWSGDDDHGRPVPGGVYFARLMTPDGTRTIRLMLRR